MRLLRALRARTLFVQITVAFLALMLPLYAMGALLYERGISSIRRETAFSFSRQTTFLKDTIEREIKSIREFQNLYVPSKSLNKLAYLPDSLSMYQRIDAYANIQYDLYIFKNHSDLISEASIHINPLNRTINSTGVDFKADGGKIYADYLASRLSASPVCMREGRVFLCMADQANYIDSSEPLYIVHVTLSKEALAVMLAQTDTTALGGTFIYFPEYGAVIGSAKSGAFEVEMAEKLLPSAGDGSMEQTSLSLSGKSWSATYTYSKELNALLVKYASEAELFRSLDSFRNLFLIFSAVSIAVLPLFCLIIRNTIHAPLVKLAQSFETLERGEFDKCVIPTEGRALISDEFKGIFGRFNQMAARLREYIGQAYENKILAQRAELRQLQSQINPHFLYNSFYILYRMAQAEGCPPVADFAHDLSIYYQYITRNANADVPLITELEHARLYASLQAIRFGERIITNIGEPPERFKPMEVPRLILQPILENAFEHGLKDKEEDGRIEVSFHEDEGGLRVDIEDNGSAPDDDLARARAALSANGAGNETTALSNIDERIRLRFGGRSGVTVTKSELGGLKVSLLFDQK